MDAPACGQYATDSPTVITSVTAGGRSKTIRHDYGCFDAPRELARLERLIDEVAGTARWVGVRHPERSEGAVASFRLLRSAQDDNRFKRMGALSP